MKNLNFLIILIISFFLFINCYRFPQEDSGEPLFISQYLPNDAATARKLSEVYGIGDFPSYSGFITTDEKFGSNMFFWFFPAQNGDVNAPILLWLQGGPGAASMYGLFSENGPFTVSQDGQSLISNPYTWNKQFALVYIDNPVGAGFSFTQSNSGYSENQTAVANNLYSALQQFFDVFTDYRDNDFYVTGESYAGKYVPSISYKIHEENLLGNNKKINLKGLAIGDGIIDPLTQFTDFGNLLFYLSMVDELQAQKFKQYDSNITNLLLAERYLDAFHVFDEELNGDKYPYSTYYTNTTGLTDYFNYREPQYPSNPYPEFLDLNSTRAAIHVGAYPYDDFNSTVESYLLDNWMRSVAEIIPTLLDNYRVMIYNGQNDIILGPVAMERFLRTVNWSGKDQYLKADRAIWRLPAPNNVQVAGYVRLVKQFYQVIVSDAGHLLPLDQPARALDMITRFILNQPF
eukprot:TRINITY_DN423_c0_g3_i1.p1 TRINITY_DN423_c0_g3~~TRINITY_DN423_c0_g3_i1.p1  ORF type:complete len:460 (-),score=215.31 TRINITY_DN423_c0_g3_i1:120-1499(-)